MELAKYASYTVKIVAMLGGDRASYLRERRQPVRRMLAEIYSIPGVTRALKLMSSMAVVLGFALDLSGQDEAGNS